MTADVPAIDYRLLSAVIQQLPRDGRWTDAQRNGWLKMMGAAVDLMIDVVDDAYFSQPATASPANTRKSYESS